MLSSLPKSTSITDPKKGIMINVVTVWWFKHSSQYMYYKETFQSHFSVIFRKSNYYQRARKTFCTLTEQWPERKDNSIFDWFEGLKGSLFSVICLILFQSHRDALKNNLSAKDLYQEIMYASSQIWTLISYLRQNSPQGKKNHGTLEAEKALIPPRVYL